MPAFLRGLWGDDLIRGREAVYLDIRRQQGWAQPEPLVVACFGDANAQYVRRRGHQAELLDRRPVVNFTGAKDRAPSESGNVNWGQAHWRHKLEAIYWGVRRFGEVIWLDWDIELIAPLPANFWEILSWGQPIQAPLRQYHRPVAYWRTEDRRKLPSGSFIYCRDVARVNWLIHLAQHKPLCSDGELLARWTEEHNGGWQGVDAYLGNGYQPFCCDLGPHVVIAPQERLFVKHRSAMNDIRLERLRAERRRRKAQKLA